MGKGTTKMAHICIKFRVTIPSWPSGIYTLRKEWEVKCAQKRPLAFTFNSLNRQATTTTRSHQHVYVSLANMGLVSKDEKSNLCVCLSLCFRLWQGDRAELMCILYYKLLNVAPLVLFFLPFDYSVRLFRSSSSSSADPITSSFVASVLVILFRAWIILHYLYCVPSQLK